MKLRVKLFPLAVLTVLIASGTCALLSDDVSADAHIAVTDGRGKTFVLEDPAEHIVTIGKGLTATAIELGFTDSIVVCDKYSYITGDPLFSELTSRISSGAVTAGGSLYSSGKDQLYTEISDAGDVDQRNVFDMERDVVFITVGTKSTSDSGKNANELESKLLEKGFKNVLIWYEITEYGQIVDLVKQVSKVLTGSVDPLAEKMENTASHINEELGGRERAKAFYVTYSGGALKVGNIGSLGTSLALAAGANVITIDGTRSETTYVTNLPELVESAGFDVIVFADNSIVSGNHEDELRKAVGNDVTIVKMEPLWNNFDPDSMYGVWTLACALYPDLFSGDVPTIPESENTNVLYLSAGIIVAAAIGIASYWVMRR